MQYTTSTSNFNFYSPKSSKTAFAVLGVDALFVCLLYKTHALALVNELGIPYAPYALVCSPFSPPVFRKRGREEGRDLSYLPDLLYLPCLGRYLVTLNFRFFMYIHSLLLCLSLRFLHRLLLPFHPTLTSPLSIFSSSR